MSNINPDPYDPKEKEEFRKDREKQKARRQEREKRKAKVRGTIAVLATTMVIGSIGGATFFRKRQADKKSIEKVSKYIECSNEYNAIRQVTSSGNFLDKYGNVTSPEWILPEIAQDVIYEAAQDGVDVTFKDINAYFKNRYGVSLSLEHYQGYTSGPKK